MLRPCHAGAEEEMRSTVALFEIAAEFSHQHLCRRRAVMFLRDRDVVHLPEASYFTLHRFENVAVNILYASSSLDGSLDEFTSFIAVYREKRLKIRIGDIGKRRTNIDVAGRRVGKRIKPIHRCLYIAVGEGSSA